MEERLLDFFNTLDLTVATGMLLLLGAAVEYVFPPFPGDTVVLLGAFMVGARGWSPAVVYLAINAGNVVGMIFIYQAGRFLVRHDAAWRARYALFRRIGEGTDRIMPYFSRRAWLYLLVNRFLPSIRALFFLAAGMAGLSLTRVLVFGGLSALAWNALLLAAGAALGDNFEKLLALSTKYNMIAWCVLAAAVLTFAAVFWMRRRRR